MALYYFTEEANPVRKATNYRARPDEARTKRAAIAVDRGAVDLYDRAKRKLGISDEQVSGVLERISRLRTRRTK
jgi:hypothetical protein